MSRRGIQYARNVQDVKRALRIADYSSDEEDVPAEMVSSSDIEDAKYTDLSIDSSVPVVPKVTANHDSSHSTGLRRRENIKRPSRFDGNFVYAVFQ